MDVPVQPPQMVDICKKFPCPPEAMALATEGPTPSVFIAKLREEKMGFEAVQALARILPKEKAVAWGAQSARMAGKSTGLSQEELKALDATEAWIANPVSENKEAVKSAVADLPATSPSSWAAQAAAFAGGVELPEGVAPLAASEDLTAHFASGAVLLSAAKTAPDGLPEIPEAPPVSEDVADVSDVSEDAVERAVEQLPESPEPLTMTPEEREAAAPYLEPFIDLGVGLAESTPGWA